MPGLLISKREQMERFFLRAGLVRATPIGLNGSASDPLQAGLGSHVLVKPAMIGASNGDGFQVDAKPVRRLRLRPHSATYFYSASSTQDHIQSLSGVLSIFGRPVSADMKKLAIARPSLDAPDERTRETRFFRGYFSSGLTMTLCYEDDVAGPCGALPIRRYPRVPFQGLRHYFAKTRQACSTCLRLTLAAIPGSFFELLPRIG